MRTIYAIQLQVTPPADQSPRDLHRKLVDAACQWIEQKNQRSWGIAESVPRDGTALSPQSGHTLRGHSRTSGDSDLFTVDWTHPADRDSSTAWVTACNIARHYDTVQIAVLIRISTTRVVLRPVRFDLGRPGLVTQILQNYSTSMDAWSVPATTEDLSSPQVDDYVNQVLVNPARALPVVMISPDVWTGAYAVNPHELFSRVQGFAHVAVLKDKWSAFKLTDAVEKPLSCYDGAVRIYWPGFTHSDHPFQHKLYPPASIRFHANKGLPLPDHLFRTFAAVASFRYTEGAAIRAVRAVFAEEERRKAEELRNEIRSGAIEKDNLELRLLEALDQVDQLTSELETSKQALAAQQAAWAEVQQSMAVTETEPSDAENTEQRQFSTVYEAVEKAKKDFSGSLLFLDSALESAKDSPFKSPDRVYEMFEALALVAGEWREKKGALGKPLGDALRDLGFDLRDQISQTSKGKWGDEYSFSYKGKNRLFEQHITIGAKQADKCLSMHLYRDDDDLVLVIGHCGRHLSNTSS